MKDNDPVLAQLWLSECGAHVPEHHTGDAHLEARTAQYGLHLNEPDRARRHSRRLALELTRLRRDGRAARA
jgi:hypothetical protein